MDKLHRNSKNAALREALFLLRSTFYSLLSEESAHCGLARGSDAEEAPGLWGPEGV